MALKNSIVNRIRHFLKILLLTLLSGIILYFAFALLFSFLPTHPPEKSCSPDNVIYFNTNGVHVDLIVPLADLPISFRNQLREMPQAHYAAFGWGDRNFYIETPEWSDLTFPVAFKALFIKSKSALHVTFYSRKVYSWKSLQLCDQQLNAIMNYIEETFQKDEQGKLKKMDFDGYNEYDSFYEAKGSFTLFNTCNVWVNRALKKAEIRTAVWTPFDFGVLHHIK